jgi:hypothetical protein
MMRSCAVCGKPFEAQKPHAKYCNKTCGKRAQRAGLASRRGSPVVRISPPVEGADGLVDAVRGVVEAAGCSGSAEGELAIVLAEKLTSESVGTAAVSKELRVVLAGLRDAKPVRELSERLDELAARRPRSS